MRGLLAPDPSILRLSGKYPADPVYTPADRRHAPSPFGRTGPSGNAMKPRIQCVQTHWIPDFIASRSGKPS
jgi:hypothetical protein